MRSPEPGRLIGCAWLWLGAVLAAAALFACDTSPADPQTFFQLQADSTWLGYDSVQVWLDKGNASAPSLLFAAKVTAVSDLEKIPADGYGNGLVIVTLRAFKDGRVARAENRGYNLAEQRMLSITVLIPPGSAGARPDSAATKGGFFLSLRPGDTLVSIGDSVPLVAVGWNDSGSLLEAQWDLDGDGAPDRVEYPGAVSAVLKAWAEFNVPGVYHPSLTLKGSQGGALKYAATVRVVLGTVPTPMPDGVTLSVGAQGAPFYGAVMDIDSEKVWTSSVANAHQSGIDLVFLFYEGEFHLEDAVNARASGIANSINLTNSYDPTKIVHVDMVRVSAEPPDQETALAVFQSAPPIHGAVVSGGDLFLVRSTGGKLAFLKVVDILGTDKAGQAVVQIKVLTL